MGQNRADSGGVTFIFRTALKSDFDPTMHSSNFRGFNPLKLLECIVQ